jgi:hypothetical protein
MHRNRLFLLPLVLVWFWLSVVGHCQIAPNYATKADLLAVQNASVGKAINKPVYNYWAIGDSQTSGALTITTNWAASGALDANLRYPNIVATTLGATLTNLGVSGSSIPFDSSTSAGRNNSFGQVSQVPVNWAGLVTVMHGYNDSYSWGKPITAYWWFHDAQRALIARLLLTDWYGAGGVNSSGSAAPGWSTTGSLVDEGYAGLNPFPTATPSTQTRRYLSLTGTNAVSITVPTAGVWAVFAERSAVGGSVYLYTNGVSAAAIDGYATSGFMTMASLTVPAGVTLTAYNISGTNKIHAIARIPAPAESSTRTIVLMSPLRLGYFSGGRLDEWGGMIGRASQAAASTYSDYRVGFADAGSSVNQAVHAIASDPSHLNPQGQSVLAKCVTNAVKVTTYGGFGFQPQDPVVQTSYGFFSGSVAVDRRAKAATVEYDTGSDTALFTSYDWLNSVYKPGMVRASTISLAPSGTTSNGLVVQSGVIIVGSGTHIRFGSSSGVLISSGTNTPEGAVTAPVGSLWLRSNGAAVTTLYVKESGSTNTGWVAK